MPSGACGPWFSSAVAPGPRFHMAKLFRDFGDFSSASRREACWCESQSSRRGRVAVAVVMPT